MKKKSVQKHKQVTIFQIQGGIPQMTSLLPP